MTTTHATGVPTSSSARAHHHRVATAAARRRVMRVLLVAGVWFWGFWALLVVGAPLAVDRWGGELEGLTYDAAGGPARWVGFAVGLITTAVLLTAHVAAGGTRRSYRDGVLQAAAVVGVVFGVLFVLLSVAEERLYSAIDRTWQGSAGPLDLDTPVGLAVTAVGEGLVVVTYVVVGVAIQAGYRTFGAWRGTLLIVPLLVPCAIADVATRTGLAGLPLRGGYDDVALGVLGTVVGGAAAAVLAAVVAGRLLRTVPLRP
ncbi:hypothetical protein [Isoptericola cucumis]|uniref:Uncharacterized protein n=1 Tax=Isoptericola cucumis TaxID=1776856 RepID=A0ABQ2B503_9MICO|nr:hypothetical protein [Isoptericola cucumis]GGI05317.1 hypothetical protein GCM10007368_05550 [Isoptericola cucumis]